MKLATFIDPAAPAGSRFGIVRDKGMIDVAAAAHALDRHVPAPSVKLALAAGPAILAALEDLAKAAEQKGLARPLDKLMLLPPIPDPSKFFCVGKNSRQHREELKANKMLTETPNEPTGFIKLTDTMCGQDSAVARPAGITTFDYEPELVFVVGKRAHRVKKADALAHIAGITVFNDLSMREIQKREVASGSRFWTAKNAPGFAPIGPFIATLDEVADVDDLWITCDVNGGRRLRENTSQFIYKIADVIEHFSHFIVFEPGDLIAMGAPKGVAVGQPNAAELYLKPGDKMEIAIEGLMTLRTTIVDDPN
ncbi:MAG TPA: fumarylacetoacetate hydrolase family protein [Pseudolabrys sp.]|nr:fumarylacetoacetate hydrolase family protein [Pseudolabrys sp.]